MMSLEHLVTKIKGYSKNDEDMSKGQKDSLNEFPLAKQGTTYH